MTSDPHMWKLAAQTFQATEACINDINEELALLRRRVADLETRSLIKLPDQAANDES